MIRRITGEVVVLEDIACCLGSEKKDKRKKIKVCLHEYPSHRCSSNKLAVHMFVLPPVRIFLLFSFVIFSLILAKKRHF
jgi:hypothetical protein